MNNKIISKELLSIAKKVAGLKYVPDMFNDILNNINLVKNDLKDLSSHAFASENTRNKAKEMLHIVDQLSKKHLEMIHSEGQERV